MGEDQSAVSGLALAITPFSTAWTPRLGDEAILTLAHDAAVVTPTPPEEWGRFQSWEPIPTQSEAEKMAELAAREAEQEAIRRKEGREALKRKGGHHHQHGRYHF